jgi:hypothetical protein
MSPRLPRVENGVLYVSMAQFAAIRFSEEVGFCGVPAWEALKRLGLTEDELWIIAFRTTKMVVEGSRADQEARQAEAEEQARSAAGAAQAAQDSARMGWGMSA